MSPLGNAASLHKDVKCENGPKGPEKESKVKKLMAELCAMVPLFHRYLVKFNAKGPASFMDVMHHMAFLVPPQSLDPWCTHSSMNVTQSCRSLP